MSRKRRPGPPPITEAERRKHRLKQRDGLTGRPPPVDSEVIVRRSDDGDKKGVIEFNRLGGLRWSRDFGGWAGQGEQLCVMATVRCTDVYEVSGKIHTGSHSGPCPHNIKVVILEADNRPQLWEKLSAQARWP